MKAPSVKAAVLAYRRDGVTAWRRAVQRRDKNQRGSFSGDLSDDLSSFASAITAMAKLDAATEDSPGVCRIYREAVRELSPGVRRTYREAVRELSPGFYEAELVKSSLRKSRFFIFSFL
jgi:hypothetical protein